MASFIAAGSAYFTHGINMIPFYIFYSMFGFQRVGDMIWAAGDTRCKGFLLGGTAGRTTLAGEGLQHQDGHSHLLAATIPNLRSYDPAYAYEVAVIVQDGIRRMYEAQEDTFYYITLGNEPYAMPPMRDGAAEGIIKGMHKVGSSDADPDKPRVQLLGSGAILNEVVRAAGILAEKYGIGSDLWSVTSYKELRRDALACGRWNMLHPGEPPRTSYLEELMEGLSGPFIAASDYMKIVAEQIAPWMPGRFLALGTDGFGRSDDRTRLRRFFEVDAESITIAALSELAHCGQFERSAVAAAIDDLGVDPEKPDPTSC